MTLGALIEQGWGDHAADPEGVFERLRGASDPAETPAEALALARLAAHVGGEHLGLWTATIALLNGLVAAAGAGTPECQGVHRLLAALHRAAGDEAASRTHQSQAHDPGLPEASTRLRILATTAAMCVGQGRLAEGIADFESAVNLAAYGPAATDPAARDLAVAANNLACTLEHRSAPTPAELALMLEAAYVARRFWTVVGGWRAIERAEYRLCMSHLKAGRPPDAVRHAAECLRIVRENGGDPAEAFFAHEASARAAHARGDLPGAVVHLEAAVDTAPAIEDPELRAFCDAELLRLGAALV